MRLKVNKLTDLLIVLSRLGVEIIIIDEFTYWVRAYEGVLSELQEYIDLHMEKYNTLLVVSGSLVSLMEKKVLGGGSPLYARTTSRLKLGPLSYKYLRALLPQWDPADRVRLYALIGGIPFYYCLASNAGSLEEPLEAQSTLSN